jgi:hypothetical protein
MRFDGTSSYTAALACSILATAHPAGGPPARMPVVGDDEAND